jgi:hypothetical protein
MLGCVIGNRLRNYNLISAHMLLRNQFVSHLSSSTYGGFGAFFLSK